ncbi:hypothetical protein WA158_007178 [Blastocystis sp. Blastoise]
MENQSSKLSSKQEYLKRLQELKSKSRVSEEESTKFISKTTTKKNKSHKKERIGLNKQKEKNSSNKSDIPERTVLFLKNFNISNKPYYEKSEKEKEYEKEIDQYLNECNFKEAERVSKEYSEYKLLKAAQVAGKKADYEIETKDERKKELEKYVAKASWRFMAKERWEQKANL